MDIALNKICGIVESFIDSFEIVRLRVHLQKQYYLEILLLENADFANALLGKYITLGFKENNIALGTCIKGGHNTFRAKIIKISQDTLFARVLLENTFLQDCKISALCPLDFIRNNALKVGDFIDWYILESEIMLLG